MPTRNIVLTTHQTSLVEHLVKSGRYQNASEVLREGLRLVEAREQEAENRMQALREAVTLGISDIEAGRYQSFASPDEIRAHILNLRKHEHVTI